MMPNRAIPIVFKMIEPVAGFDQWRTIAADRIGKSHAVGGAAVANFLPLVGCCQAIALDGKDFDRLRYVLEILRSETAIAKGDFLLHLIVGLTGDANAAVLRDAFEAGGNIDAIAVQVVVFDDDVAKMDADTKRHLAVARRTGIARRHGPLDFSGTRDAFD